MYMWVNESREVKGDGVAVSMYANRGMQIDEERSGTSGMPDSRHLHIRKHG